MQNGNFRIAKFGTQNPETTKGTKAHEGKQDQNILVTPLPPRSIEIMNLAGN